MSAGPTQAGASLASDLTQQRVVRIADIAGSHFDTLPSLDAVPLRELECAGLRNLFNRKQAFSIESPESDIKVSCFVALADIHFSPVRATAQSS